MLGVVYTDGSGDMRDLLGESYPIVAFVGELGVEVVFGTLDVVSVVDGGDCCCDVCSFLLSEAVVVVVGGDAGGLLVATLFAAALLDVQPIY